MTTELSLQTDTVKAVIDAGGFAFKMSHKFKVGVADLFVKLPGLPAAFFEVKYGEAPKTRDCVNLDATPLQKKFIRDARSAGMASGFLSFLRRSNEIGVCACLDSDTVRFDWHRWGRLASRRWLIIDEITDWLER